MQFKTDDIVKPSGNGRTRNWPIHIRGKVIRVQHSSVFVVWDATHFEDEMKPDEVDKVQ